MLNFAVTLRSGGDFEPWDAITLANQVREHLHIPHTFCCFTDMEIDDDWIKVIPLKHGWPGWWSMIEMFSLVGPVIASGLDMIVVNDIGRLGEMAITCPEGVFYMARPQFKSRSKGEKWCSGLQIWNGDWSWLCDNFDPDIHIKQFKREQRYTAHMLHNDDVEIRSVQKYFDGYYSYKNHCRRRKPNNARVVLFHGHPRPNECRDKWVRDIYNNPNIYEHPFETIKMETEDEAENSVQP